MALSDDTFVRARRRLVVAAGAWTPELLRELGVDLAIEIHSVAWGHYEVRIRYPLQPAASVSSVYFLVFWLLCVTGYERNALLNLSQPRQGSEQRRLNQALVLVEALDLTLASFLLRPPWSDARRRCATTAVVLLPPAAAYRYTAAGWIGRPLLWLPAGAGL